MTIEDWEMFFPLFLLYSLGIVLEKSWRGFLKWEWQAPYIFCGIFPLVYKIEKIIYNLHIIAA